MFVMRMYTTIRNQTDEMHLFVIFFGIFESIQQHWIFLRFPLLECLVDEQKLLINNASCPDIQMPYLRISHLAIR